MRLCCESEEVSSDGSVSVHPKVVSGVESESGLSKTRAYKNILYNRVLLTGFG